MKITATQAISTATGKVLVKIYQNLGPELNLLGVNTDYRGNIKRRGDTVIAEDGTKYLCDQVEVYAIDNVDMISLESFTMSDNISSEIAKHISDGVTEKIKGLKLSNFAGQVFIERLASGGYSVYFIYGYAL